MFKSYQKIIALLSLVFFISLSNPVLAQTPSEKKQEGRKKQRKVSAEEAEKELKERHLKMQDKEVQKRMKKSLKEAERRKRNKKPPFYETWFQPKRKTGKASKSKGGK
jgi:cytochrome c biogenesis protein ResB